MAISFRVVGVVAAAALLVAQAHASPRYRVEQPAANRAMTAAAINLGAPPTPCSPSATTCCPGADCVDHPEFIVASPLLVETAIGVETISSHLIHVGQRFTIKFHALDPAAALWTFPDIAKKVSRCKTGVDLACTYVAVKQDVTYPFAATYDGWSEFKFGAINHNGIGVGYNYYAVVGGGIPVIGRLADARGRGVARGGIQNPGGPTPDPGVLIDFSAKRHGVLTPLYAAAPSVHGSVAHPYDVGYYGLTVKPGTYAVSAGDRLQNIRCKSRRIHVTHPVYNFNLVCN
jgi:hypothetical protein